MKFLNFVRIRKHFWIRKFLIGSNNCPVVHKNKMRPTYLPYKDGSSNRFIDLFGS